MNNKISIIQTLSIAEKWNIASDIWHSNFEEDIIIKLLDKINLNKNATIADVACGTGFHSFLFHQLGYNVLASDIDVDNLRILSEKQEKENIYFPVIKADWKSINNEIFSKFDALFCLGSSITYFESWEKDSNINNDNRISGLINVLENFKSLLKPNSKLVVGYSKHYPTTKNIEIIPFDKTTINGNEYSMEWELHFDWERKVKNWFCKIISGANDYSFNLESHLYSKEEFIEICKKVFKDVYVVETPKNYYDDFIICGN